MTHRLPLLALSLLGPSALADEGMWLPEQLPAMADTLAAMGLELPPEQLADPLAPPLNAVISLGGCSAAFISAEGLIATNHHCVSGYLQFNSDAANNRARDGHLARDRAEELPAGPGSRVQVVESITDVTAEVLRGVKPRTADARRSQLVEANIKRIVAGCEATPDRRCRVAGFYGGQQYRLIRALELRDLRLVYAPPRAVGEYGGEQDNWEWPRHAGDFALLRAYVGPDGGSADPAPENQPYRPPHHLPLATGDLDPGDFVMVAGYPGSTYRYRSAAELEHHQEVAYPFMVDLLTRELAILTEEAAASEEAAARLDAPIDGTSNYLKYTRGMLDNFRSSDVLARKRQEDAALRAWIDESPDRAATYGRALDELDALIAVEQATDRRDTLVGALFWAGDLLSVAHDALRLAGERQKPDLQRDFGYQDRDLDRRRQRYQRLERGLWLPADRRLVALILGELLALEDEGVPALGAWVEARGGLDAALDQLYAAPALAETAARLALLEMDRAALEASEDPWVQLAVALEAHLAPERAADKERAGARQRVSPVVMEALIASKGGLVYPDANGTLRVTVGHVRGYSPRDGVAYLPQTTLAGVAAKAGDFPFDAPAPLLARVDAGPASRWADPELGDVPVNFLSTLDSTGGNSGSATLNARGELVGLLFDGNYEAMSADWLFDPALTRSIHVDLRYLLWTLDEVEGAHHLLKELGL